MNKENSQNQVKDDHELLDLMTRDREIVIKIFKPTNFWNTLEKNCTNFIGL